MNHHALRPSHYVSLLIPLLLALAACAGRKESSADEGDSATDTDSCPKMLEIEDLHTLRTAGDTPNHEPSVYDDDACELFEVCFDSYILPMSVFNVHSGHRTPDTDPHTTDELLYIAPDGTTIRSEITDEHYTYDRDTGQKTMYIQRWQPAEALAPSTSYDVWRSTGTDRCFDFALVTSPHGSPLSLSTTLSPVVQVRIEDLHYLFENTAFTSVYLGDQGGPDIAIQFNEIADNLASVRVAAVLVEGEITEQSWCRATLDTVIAVDENGAFQIPGIPWRGSGAIDASYGGDFLNLLVEPFTISGYLAPDGQNAIVTFDDVLLDGRLTGDGCDWGAWDVFEVQCPDGEICCMDMSTGPTITEPSPLTSIEYIAQDNCHPRCPTSADNPDCTLP